MAPDPHARNLDEEIAEIENRRGIRNLFLILGGGLGLLLLVVVVLGARERVRLREESARPQTEIVEMGRHVGTVSNTAVFASDDRLQYVEGVGDAPIEAGTTFARRLEYDTAGQPDELPPQITHWSLDSSDSLPYIVEPVLNPLTGVSAADYRDLALGSLRREDYGSGMPNDWRALEREGTNVSITGQAQRAEGAVYLTADPVRVRLQGIEGLSSLDSLEVAWATANNAPLSAFGRISSTPRGGDAALFVMSVDAVEPPSPAEAEAIPPEPGATDTAGGAADTAP